jgi:DNA-binding MarR family transcriptional regulator
MKLGPMGFAISSAVVDTVMSLIYHIRNLTFKWGTVPKARPSEHPMAKHLGYIMKRAQHALHLSMDAKLNPLGLTLSQYNVLTAVRDKPGISNAALARAAFMTAQSMQGIVANLERLGLMQREPDPNNGRVKQSALTPNGKRILTEAIKAVAGIERDLTSGLSAAEIDTLCSLLHRCTDNLSR